MIQKTKEGLMARNKDFLFITDQCRYSGRLDSDFFLAAWNEWQRAGELDVDLVDCIKLYCAL